MLGKQSLGWTVIKEFFLQLQRFLSNRFFYRIKKYFDLVEGYAKFDTDNNRKYTLNFIKTNFLIYFFAKSNVDFVKDLDVVSELGRKYSLREEGYSGFSVTADSDGNFERDVFVFKSEGVPEKENV